MDTYTYEPVFRGSAYALLASAVVVAVATLWIAFSGAGSSEWIPALGLLTLTLASGYQSAGTLLSTFRLVGTPPFPPPVIRLLALLLLGIVTGVYVQAVRVLQSGSIRREFLGENKEAIM